MLSYKKNNKQEEQKMLEFQKEYSIAHQSFEDFILVVFVLVDVLYKKVAPKSLRHRPNIHKAILNDSEKAWYKKNYQHLLPRMVQSKPI